MQRLPNTGNEIFVDICEDMPVKPGDLLETIGVSSQKGSSQYSIAEKEQAVDVIKLLIKVRDRCRKRRLINW